ncbi:MAG: Asp-tRNA(Asn)/Glu-tRNA(Gln) amidotransferase subunit GatC [Candidatus Dormibacteria bacterium]
MKLSLEQVRHVAMLARLGLSDPELEAMSTELSGILDYIDQLSEIDTSMVPPTARIDDLGNVWREDVVGSSVGQEAALSNAPSREGEYFRVRAMQEG